MSALNGNYESIGERFWLTNLIFSLDDHGALVIKTEFILGVNNPPSSQLTWTHWQHQSFSFRVSGHPSISRQETLRGQTSQTQFFFLMHDRPLRFTWLEQKDRDRGKAQKDMDQNIREDHIVQDFQTSMETQLCTKFVNLRDVQNLLPIAFRLIMTKICFAIFAHSSASF